MKKNWHTLCAFIMTAIIYCLGQSAYAAPKTLDEIVAVVNNDVILESSVDALISNVEKSTPKDEIPDPTTLRKQVIDHLITNALILQQAQHLNINVTDKDVDQAINNIAKQNNTTINNILKQLASSGISENTYRRQIREEMMMEQAKALNIRQRINIQPQEVDNLAKQLKEHLSDNTELNLSHILIALPENPTQQQIADAEAKANTVIKKARAGESFSKLATSYSSDSYALNGGLLGWGRLAEFPSLFAENLQNARKGIIIGPIRSGAGFHILRVNDMRGNTAQKESTVEYNARHILLKTSVILSDEQAKAKLIQITKEIKAGKITFEQAAKKFSEDPGSADNGGELGWVRPDYLDPIFAKNMTSLNKGQISEPIKSSFGWHIIQLINKRTIDTTDDQQKDTAYKMIFNRKFNEELPIWIQEIRAGAYIKIFDNDTNE